MIGASYKPLSLPMPLQVFSAPLIAWWDYGDPNGDNTLLADNTSLSSVIDKSPSKFNLSQATGSLKGQFKLSAINGRPAMYMDGTRAMQVTASGTYSQITHFCVFMLAALPTGFHHIFGNDGFGGGAQHFLVQTTNAINLAVSGRTPSNTLTGNVLAISTPYIAVAKDNGTTASMLLNAVSVFSATITTPANKILGASYVGAWNSGGLQRFFNGYLGEHLIFGGELSTAESIAIRQYLSNRWGISG